LFGAYRNYGVDFFKLCPRDWIDIPGLTISWKYFQYKAVPEPIDGRPRKRIAEVFCTTPFSEFLDFF
jgi:hypothetical protein